MDEAMVEVPLSLAREIVGLSQRLARYVPGRPDPDLESCYVKGQGQTPWTEKQVIQFKAAIAHLAGATAVVDFVAASPDEVVSYERFLKDNSDLDPNRVRGELSAMTKLSGRAIGEKKWPMEAWQDSSDGVMRYRMPAVVADWWKQA